MKKIFLGTLLLPLIALAQAGELSVGDRNVSYDSVSENEVGTLYYQGENLVASEHNEVTLVYENDIVVLEAHDTDGDGKLDAFLEISDNGVTSMTGEGAGTFERPEVVELEQLIAQDGGGEEEDLVGSLDSIDIPGRGLSFSSILLLLVLAGGGYWYYKKRQEETPKES